MKKEGFIESRIMGLFASLFFSVPTAAFLWFGINKNIAIHGGFINSNVLWASIGIFSVLAIVVPNVFPYILGTIWRWILGVQRWVGW